MSPEEASKLLAKNSRLLAEHTAEGLSDQVLMRVGKETLETGKVLFAHKDMKGCELCLRMLLDVSEEATTRIHLFRDTDVVNLYLYMKCLEIRTQMGW